MIICSSVLKIYSIIFDLLCLIEKQRRRDSINRPVLKLHISSNTMERQHRINGETSLDHPFLKRLNSHKYGNAGKSYKVIGIGYRCQ